MTKFAPLLIVLFVFTGCYQVTYVDNLALNLFTEADKCYMTLGSTGDITIWIESTDNDLSALSVTPQTAYIWTNGASYRLIPHNQDLGYKGRPASYPKGREKNSIGFYLKLEPIEGRKDNRAIPFNPGTYNISMQFSGDGGIHTLCGSFRVKSQTKPFPNIQG